MIDEFKSLQLLIVGYYCKDFIGFAIMLDLNSLYWWRLVYNYKLGTYYNINIIILVLTNGLRNRQRKE